MKERRYADTISLITGPQSVPWEQRSNKGNKDMCVMVIVLDVQELDLDWDSEKNVCF